MNNLNDSLNKRSFWGLHLPYIFLYPAFVLSREPYLLTEGLASQRQFEMVATIRLHAFLMQARYRKPQRLVDIIIQEWM